MAISLTKKFTSSYVTFPFSLSIFIILLQFLSLAKSQSRICRNSCGNIPIHYPFGIDDGCGSPFYKHILICTNNQLEFITPSRNYPVTKIIYSDPHILVTDPFMWSCQDRDDFRPTRPFNLDIIGTHFTLSRQNDYLFFNCSEKDVIIEPKPMFCERFPEQCDSTCDSSSYLCKHLPKCEGSGLRRSSSSNSSTCCSYYPKATESLRLMLKHCATYTSVYWRNLGVTPAAFDDEVPEYGIRIDFDIQFTTRCLKCQDSDKGKGICGFDTKTLNFLCLCDNGNSTTNCNDGGNSRRRSGVVAGTATAFSVAGAFGIGVGVWYLRKVRAKAPVTHGVQSNDNRLF